MFKDRIARIVVSALLAAASRQIPTAAESFPTTTEKPSRIVLPVNDSVRVAIPGSTHPMARPALDQGPVDGSTLFRRMILVLGSSPDQESRLQTLLDLQQSKGSAEYHHWLTPEEFGARFGPSPQDIAQVTGWLQGRGFKVGSVAKSGRSIEFSGTSVQVEEAFQTQMRRYNVGGESHIANATDISIPAALSPVVRGVVSLNDFFSRPLHRTVGSLKRTSGGMYLHPDSTFPGPGGSVTHALAPGDFANIYDLNPLYSGSLTGSGQTIAIVARSDINAQDVTDFRTSFGLPTPVPLNVILDGPDPGDVPGDDVEATLDAEWAGAVAPGATIDLVISASTLNTDGVEFSAQYIVENNLAPIMSVSFGLCELFLNGSGADIFVPGLWQQAAAQGISVFVSAGDNGAAGCDDPNDPRNGVATGGLAVNGLASTPFNTAVGGTEFNESGSDENPAPGTTDATFWNSTNAADFVSAKGYIPEMVWNQSCDPTAPGSACAKQGNLFAGSGGTSKQYGAQSWEKLSIPGLGGFLNRAIPDVSLSAAIHDPYLVCFQQSCEGANASFLGVGGTSASSPSFAGIMALIVQKVAGERQGIANYLLYQLASHENYGSCSSNARTNPAAGTSCVFNDILVGNNGVPGNDVSNNPVTGALGFPAVSGYDLASGLGSVNAANLANAWAAAAAGFQPSTTTFLSPSGSTISITHSQPVNFMVQVANANPGITQTPTGQISLIAQGGTLSSPFAPGAGGEVLGPTGTSGTASTGVFSIANLPGGNYTLSASFPGDGFYAPSVSTSNFAVTVSPEPSSIGFFPSPQITTSNYGDPIPLRIFVTPNTVGPAPINDSPSGQVTFLDGGNPVGTLTLNIQGEADLINCITPAPVNVVCLAIGTHNIGVSYSGDASFNPSGPIGPFLFTVNKGNPHVALQTPSTAIAGQAINLNALVPATGLIQPTGSVQFLDGSASLGSSALVVRAGIPTATLQVTLATTGNHSITSSYSGDGTYNAAVSTASQVNVVAPFNFTTAAGSQTIAAGGTATYNITLNAASGFSGQVNFSCTGAPGGATCAVSPNPATLTSTTTSLALTATVSNTANARAMPGRWKTVPFVLAAVLAIPLLGRKKQKKSQMLLLIPLLLVTGVSSCGGGSSNPRPPTNAALIVTGTSGAISNSITLSLTVTH
jgi:hypothetical protein